MVTTGRDADGRAIVRSDRYVRVDESRGAVRAGRFLAVNVPATSVDDGDADAGPLVTGPGSLTVDALVVEPTTSSLVDPTHATSDSFEAFIVIGGELRVAVGSDEVTLEPGSVFVARGMPFAARTSPEIETRLLVVRAEPGHVSEPAVATSLRARADRHDESGGSWREPTMTDARRSCTTETLR